MKVRSYGLFRVGDRRRLSRVRTQLQLLQLLAGEALAAPDAREGGTRAVSCPNCGRPMRVEQVLRPHNRGPPQRGHTARAAKTRHVLSGMVCYAPACFGVPQRACDDHTPVQVRSHALQSGPDVCARTSGQHPQARCVRIGKTAKERRLTFEQVRPHTTPQMKFHI